MYTVLLIQIIYANCQWFNNPDLKLIFCTSDSENTYECNTILLNMHSSTVTEYSTNFTFNDQIRSTVTGLIGQLKDLPG